VTVAEAGAAALAGSAFGLGLAYLATLASDGQRGPLQPPSSSGYLEIGGMAFGCTAGAALGTLVLGSIARQDHRDYGAYLGAPAGLPVSPGLVVAAAALENDGKPGALLLIPALAAPPAGAVVGYDLTPPCGCFATSRRGGQMLIPSVGLTSTAAGGVTSVGLDVRLVTARF
jgi:hypothetical protein